jgi:hypothetical protein
MTDQSPFPSTLKTRPCIIDIGCFRWDIYNNDRLFQTSATSFGTEEKAHASGSIELERLGNQ